MSLRRRDSSRRRLWCVSPGESAGEGRAATGPTSGSAQARAPMIQAFELCTDEATV